MPYIRSAAACGLIAAVMMANQAFALDSTKIDITATVTKATCKASPGPTIALGSVGFKSVEGKTKTMNITFTECADLNTIKVTPSGTEKWNNAGDALENTYKQTGKKAVTGVTAKVYLAASANEKMRLKRATSLDLPMSGKGPTPSIPVTAVLQGEGGTDGGEFSAPVTLNFEYQ